MLEAHGISHYEEPCPYWEFEQTKQVRDALAIDVDGELATHDRDLARAALAEGVTLALGS